MYERIQILCEQNGTTITKLCILITGSSGNLNTWKKGYMRTDYLKKIADYFNVSTDYLLTGEEKSSLPDLTENEQRILDIFKRLTESQQGQIIGRAELMAEYSMPASAQHKQYTTHIAAFGGGNVETTATDEQLARAIKATEELKKSKK